MKEFKVGDYVSISNKEGNFLGGICNHHTDAYTKDIFDKKVVYDKCQSNELEGEIILIGKYNHLCIFTGVFFYIYLVHPNNGDEINIIEKPTLVKQLLSNEKITKLNNKRFSNNELETLVMGNNPNYEIIEEIIVMTGKCTSEVTTIFKCIRDNNFYCLNWTKGNIEFQENEFYEQPYIVIKKISTSHEWIAAPKN